MTPLAQSYYHAGCALRHARHAVELVMQTKTAFVVVMASALLAIALLSGCTQIPIPKANEVQTITLASTGSMGEEWNGARVSLIPTPYVDLKAFMVVSYMPAWANKKFYVAHRLLYFKGEGLARVWVVKGDGNPTIDPTYLTYANYYAEIRKQ